MLWLRLKACGLLLFNSCAKHIYVDYQYEPANTGKVVLKPNKPTQRKNVTINDSLVVNKKFVKSITLNNVPNGAHVVNYTSENIWYKEKLNAEIPLTMEPNREITKLVEVPPFSTGYCITFCRASRNICKGTEISELMIYLKVFSVFDSD